MFVLGLDRYLRAARWGALALLALLAGCASTPDPDSPRPELDAAAVVAGGAPGLSVGDPLHPGFPTDHPLSARGLRAKDPDLSRIEVWTDSEGRLVLMGAVFHEHVQAAGETILARHGLTKGAPAGHLIGRFRPRAGDPALSQAHRRYYTKLTVYGTDRPDVWVSYERDRRLYAIYRGEDARALAAVQARRHPLVEPQLELIAGWPEAQAEWDREGPGQVERRLALYVEWYPRLRALPTSDRIDDTFGPRPPGRGVLRDQLLAAARATAPTASRARRYLYQVLSEHPSVFDNPRQLEALPGAVRAVDRLEQATGYAEIHAALSAVLLSPLKDSPAAPLRQAFLREAVARGAARDRAAGTPSSARVDEAAIRLTPLPFPQEVARVREAAVAFDRLKGDLGAQLDFLAEAGAELSDGVPRVLWALTGLGRSLQGEVTAAVRAAEERGLLATATALALRDQAARAAAPAPISLEQAVSGSAVPAQRAAAKLWLELGPPVQANNVRGRDLHRRLLEPPHLDMPVFALAGVLPVKIEDAAQALAALDRPPRHVRVRADQDGGLTIEPADGPPPRGFGFAGLTDLNWLGVSAETRREAQRLAKESEEIAAAKEGQTKEAAAIDAERRRLDERLSALQRRKQAGATPHQIKAEFGADAAAETALNARAARFNRAVSELNRRVRDYNVAVNTNNLRVNKERAQGIKKLRERLDAALAAWFDGRLAAYEASLRERGTPTAERVAELAWARWLVGRGAAPTPTRWRPPTGGEVLERRLTFYRAEVWREADTAAMARAFVRAVEAAEPLGRVKELESDVQRFTRGYDPAALENALRNLGTPGAKQLVAYLARVRVN